MESSKKENNSVTDAEVAYKKSMGLRIEALRSVATKFSEINKYIESGKEIPAELSKNFVSFPLSDDPYSEIE